MSEQDYEHNDEREAFEKAHEEAYTRGNHMAWRMVLQTALHNLLINQEPKDEPLIKLARVTLQLEGVRGALRRLCSDKGIEFDEELCLQDIVDKYIAPHIPDQDSDGEE